MEISHDKLNVEETAAIKAALAYIARQERTEHPKGSFDKAMLWIPDPSEKSPSVLLARDPSEDWPYSKFNAARSLSHCAWLHGADETMTRDCLNLLTFKPTKAGLRRIGERRKIIIGAVSGKLIQAKMSIAVDEVLKRQKGLIRRRA